MTVEIRLDDAVCSANHARGQCDDLATAHLLSSSRIESAQSGWVDSSAAAIQAKLDTWRRLSDALLARLADHAQGLHTIADLIATTEATRARDLALKDGEP
ncbi:hypothetical protein [Mycobacterium sp. 1274756.6]|uniref:hypothetical protein n=1 Tax=Mycobacterium sp. 1274756.6 TaxID=1834076 RepID=UPI0007FE4407|nr:hypothetical protein [Mycobacterium sp. 1274756.6]OBJ71212.1 hypothetical protein A5643_08130 [Mycobacterium sp. 1274756.6]